MAEMIIPGTYITVRAEGLISAGRVAAGIIGIVGTAESGPVGIPVTLFKFAEAREVFGESDGFNRPENGANPLTLVRSLEHMYNNGASTVLAVRVAGSAKSNATFNVQDANRHSVASLTAKTPGTWGNNIRIEIDKAEDNCRIENEIHTESFDRLNHVRIVPSSENRIRIFRGITRQIETPDIVYKRIIKDEEVTPNTEGRYFLANIPVERIENINLIRVLGETVREYGLGSILYGSGNPPELDEIRINDTTGEIIFEATQVPKAAETVMATYAVGHADPEPGQILLTVWDGKLDFATNEAPQASDGDKLEASYLVDEDDCVQVSLVYKANIEKYIVPDGTLLAKLINESSRLVTGAADVTYGQNLPNTGVSSYFGTGTNAPGNNGAEAGRDEYALGLEGLANQLVNIVVLAGQDARGMGSVLQGHLNSTEQTDNERIGVIGASGSSLADFLGHTIADERLILVAPGMAYPDNTILPPAYTAACVAGLISSIPVQTSLTNKTLNIPGIALDFNKGQQEQLIKRNVLTVVLKNGFRILKGITTSGEGTPFSSIPTRRIVDYAKYGVRSAANPYIGRLNNFRVRAALKATLDAFLTRMVDDEALTVYELEVTATRAQEIAGEVSVVMILQPTFSIDFIRVTMILK